MHLNEQKIELFFLNAPEVEVERAMIEAHIKQCPGCSGLYDDIVSYYKDVEADLAAQQNVGLILKQNFPTLSEQSLIKEFRQWVANREVNMALPVRVARWIVRHPYLSSCATVSFFGSLIAAMLAFNTPKISEPEDKNPTHAEFVGEMMIIKNKYGNKLYEERIGIKSVKFYNDYLTQYSRAPIAFIDVDGDGINEVIWTEPVKIRNVAISKDNSVVKCKSIKKDKILWTDSLNRRLEFPNQNDYYTNNFIVRDIGAGDYDKDGKPEVYILTSHAAMFPAMLLKLNGGDGKELGNYVHPGHLFNLKYADINNDGITEIFTYGISNAFKEACICVLDPRFISGHAPLTDRYKVTGYTAGQEIAYILIPKTIIGKAVDRLTEWNTGNINEIYENNRTFVMSVLDCDTKLGGAGYQITFDFDFNITAIRGGDYYGILGKKLFQEGKIDRMPDEKYLEEYKKEIQYWDGDKFVNYPTMNKRYLEAVVKYRQP
jgi:hypothetical protein